MTPIPAVIYREWFPATVTIPGEPMARRNTKTYATPEGLYIFQQGGILDATGSQPAWHSPIVFDETPEPGTDYASTQRGWIIVTEAGPVRVAKQGGCGCSYRTIKGWQPTWAARVTQWAVSA